MTTDKNSSDTYALSKSLQKLIKGTGLVFVGQLVMLFFSFISGVLIARTWTASDLGIFSLASSVLGICITISALGLSQGVVRSIAHSIGKNEFKKIPDYIVASIFFSVMTSIILGLILFLFSEEIALNIFHETSLIYPLKLFAVALPFFILNNKIVSIFRGFEILKPTVYFEYILESVLFLIFIVGIIAFELPFINVFYVYISVRLITSVALIIYAIRQTSSLAMLSIKSVVSPAAKELVFFSLPLLGTAMLQLVTSSTDKLMLGVFKNAADVGFYSVANPLAQFILFPLSALLLIYIPVFSRLYAKGLLEEVKRNYLIITKWFCLATFPLFIMLFLFSESTITVLFGPNYVPSAIALRILSLAYISNIFVGPCGPTLIGLGRSRFVMFATAITAILNVILNAVLIPPYGLAGAATATGISIAFSNFIRIWKVYSIIKIQPFSKNLIKPTLFSIVLIIPIYFISQQFLTIDWWSLILLFILFYGVYIISVLLTKSLDEEDIKMLLAIERKTGIKSKHIRRFISKFL